jgi:hypothetical protein
MPARDYNENRPGTLLCCPAGVIQRAKPSKVDCMHHSRINGLLIDCNTDDIDAAAQFWAAALGRPVDMKHPGTRGNYRMLETPPDELSARVQRVHHESRVHIDIRVALLG